MSKLKISDRNSGINALFFGMMFLFSPSVMLFDPFPDFIGYAFMIYGLTRLRDLSPELSTARRGFARLMLLSLSKLILAFVNLFLLDGGYLMVLTFVYALADGVLGIFVFRHFFLGLFYIGSRYDGNALLKSLDTFARWMYALIMVNALAMFLPQSLYLWFDEELGYVLASYQLPFYLLSALLTLVFGIIWLVQLVRLWRASVGDTAFCDNIQKDYAARVTPKTDVFLGRRLRAGLLCFGWAMAVFYDFYFDGINIMPDVIAAVLAFVGFAVVRRDTRWGRRGMILSAVCGALSCADYAVSIVMARRYYDTGLSVTPRAVSQIRLSIVLDGVCTALSAALLLLILFCFQDISRQYTSHRVTEDMEAVKQRDISTRRSFTGRSVLLAVTGTVSLLSGAVNYAALYFFPQYWVWNILPCLAFLLTAIWLVSTLREYLLNRYL